MHRPALVLLTLLVALLACPPAGAQEDSDIPPWERQGDDDDSAGGTDGESPDDEDEDEHPADEAEDRADEDDDYDEDDEDDDEDDEDDDYDEDDRDDRGDEDDEDDVDAAPRASRRGERQRPLDVYRRDELRLWRYRTAEEYPNAFAALFRPRVRWGVRSAAGTPYTPYKLARFIGDDAMANKVAGQQAGFVSLGGGIAALGLGLLIGGSATYAIANTREEEGRATGRRGDLQGATGALTAGLLLGPILIGTGTSITIGMLRRTRQVARYYDREDAEDAIEDYNERLLRSLDLDWEDVEARELRRVPLELRLAVGPAVVGLTLTF